MSRMMCCQYTVRIQLAYDDIVQRALRLTPHTKRSDIPYILGQMTVEGARKILRDGGETNGNV